MTLLIGWVARDSRKISSVYIASDSRFSWNTANKTIYDYGRKVYSLQNSPDILGYCGDVSYPTTILSQILDMDKERILFPKNATNKDRINIIYNQIIEKFDNYPSGVVMGNYLEIIHFSRDKETDFICFKYKWTKNNGWTCVEQVLPEASDKVIILGSGKEEFYDRYLTYFKANNGKTSRAIFQCLCHTLLEIKDLQCGGPPQLVGLYNRFNGKNFGLIYKEKRFFLGKDIEILESEEFNNLEWRNELFERYDGVIKKILNGAQRQPNDLNP